MTEIENVATYMRRHSLMLATAESCTAGLIASHRRWRTYPAPVACWNARSWCIRLRPSSVVWGSPTKYWLATTSPARKWQAPWCRAQRCGAPVVIANTGVADDGGDGVAAGTQCFAWLLRAPGCKDGLYTETRQFSGDRNTVREAAAQYALERVPHYHALWTR